MTQAADGRSIHTAAQADAPDRFPAEDFSNSLEPRAVLQVPPGLPHPLHASLTASYSLWKAASDSLTTISVACAEAGLYSVLSARPLQHFQGHGHGHSHCLPHPPLTGQPLASMLACPAPCPHCVYLHASPWLYQPLANQSCLALLCTCRRAAIALQCWMPSTGRQQNQLPCAAWL